MTVLDTRSTAPSAIAQFLAIIYSATAFALTFAFFANFIIFLGNLPTLSEPWVDPTVDTGTTVHPVLAVIANLALVALFGLQHSLMARPSFKRWWTQIVPKGLERSTYVMAASVAGFVLVMFWQPIPFVIWDVSGALETFLWIVFAAGWLILLWSAIAFDIFDLLGVRHAVAWARGNPPPAPKLVTGGPYRLFRHPMYVGVLLGIWVTPYMTIGHIVIGAAFTVYILIARRYEERDLRRTFGAAYGSAQTPRQPH